MSGTDERRRIAGILASPRTRFGVLAVLVVGLSVALIVLGGPSRSGIESLIDSAGVAAPLLFIALYVVMTVLMFPGAVMTAAAGVVFGTAWGTALAVVGAGLGAVAAFEAGRWLGREQVERISGDRLSRLDDWLEGRGFTAVLYLRLIPIVPFNVLNYVAGVTAIRRQDYALATVLGIVPGTFAYAALGGNISDPTSPAFIGAVVLIVVLAAGAPLVNRALRRRGIGAPDPESDPEESDTSTPTPGGP